MSSVSTLQAGVSAFQLLRSIYTHLQTLRFNPASRSLLFSTRVATDAARGAIMMFQPCKQEPPLFNEVSRAALVVAGLMFQPCKQVPPLFNSFQYDGDTINLTVSTLQAGASSFQRR